MREERSDNIPNYKLLVQSTKLLEYRERLITKEKKKKKEIQD